MRRIPLRAYKRTLFHGKLLDRATIKALKKVEAILGYELTILQGIGGAAASAGTHLRGRAVDLAAFDWENKMKALKKVGFAVWYRPALPGVWGAHLHAVLILGWFGNAKGLAASGFKQIGSFLRGNNGLADDGPDQTPFRFDPQPVFIYNVAEQVETPKPTNVTRARDALVEAMVGLSRAAAMLDDADKSRVKARAQIDEINRLEREVHETLAELPPR